VPTAEDVLVVAVGTGDGFLTLWDVTNRCVLAMVCHSLAHSAVRSISTCTAVASSLSLEAVAPSRPLFAGPDGTSRWVRGAVLDKWCPPLLKLSPLPVVG
jgi:hypothetical protein